MHGLNDSDIDCNYQTLNLTQIGKISANMDSESSLINNHMPTNLEVREESNDYTQSEEKSVNSQVKNYVDSVSRASKSNLDFDTDEMISNHKIEDQLSDIEMEENSEDYNSDLHLKFSSTMLVGESFNFDERQEKIFGSERLYQNDQFFQTEEKNSPRCFENSHAKFSNIISKTDSSDFYSNNKETSDPPMLDSASELNETKKTHPDPVKKPFQCDVCQRGFAQRVHLRQHILVHTKEKAFTCDVCMKSFSLSFNLKKHYLIHTETKPYVCEICSKRFRQHITLKHHYLSHDQIKPFECDICKKCFTHISNLRRHSRVHTNEIPYECEICKKRYNHQSNLKRHYRVHSNEFPYECDICYKRFTRQSNFKDHQEIHVIDKPFSCSDCSKSFGDETLLIKHQRIHTQMKPFECDVCHKMFSRPSLLKNHYVIHSDERLHKCDQCDKSFKRGSDLRKHLLIHKRADTAHLNGDSQISVKLETELLIL